MSISTIHTRNKPIIKSSPPLISIYLQLLKIRTTKMSITQMWPIIIIIMIKIHGIRGVWQGLFMSSLD